MKQSMAIEEAGAVPGGAVPAGVGPGTAPSAAQWTAAAKRLLAREQTSRRVTGRPGEGHAASGVAVGEAGSATDSAQAGRTAGSASEEETIWITQAGVVELTGRDRTTVWRARNRRGALQTYHSPAGDEVMLMADVLRHYRAQDWAPFGEVGPESERWAVASEDPNTLIAHLAAVLARHGRFGAYGDFTPVGKADADWSVVAAEQKGEAAMPGPAISDRNNSWPPSNDQQSPIATGHDAAHRDPSRETSSHDVPDRAGSPASPSSPAPSVAPSGTQKLAAPGAVAAGCGDRDQIALLTRAVQALLAQEQHEVRRDEYIRAAFAQLAGARSALLTRLSWAAVIGLLGMIITNFFVIIVLARIGGLL
jgi:hypothetical protein